MGSGPAGSVFAENSFYRETLDIRRWGTGFATFLNEILTSQAAVRRGRAGQISGTRPCEDCSRVQLVVGRQGQYSGKIHFIEKPGIQVERGGVATAQQQYGTGEPGTGPCRDCGRVRWGSGSVGSVFGENSFYRGTCGTSRWGRHVAKRSSDTPSPKRRYATGEPGKVQGRDHVGIVEGSCEYRARGVSTRGKFVLSRNLGYKTMGDATWLNAVLTLLSPAAVRYGRGQAKFWDGTVCGLLQ